MHTCVHRFTHTHTLTGSYCVFPISGLSRLSYPSEEASLAPSWRLTRRRSWVPKDSSQPGWVRGDSLYRQWGYLT